MGVYEYLNNEPYCHPPGDPQCKSDLYPLAIVLFIAIVLQLEFNICSIALFALTAA